MGRSSGSQLGRGRWGRWQRQGNAVSRLREPVYGGEEPWGRCGETLEAACSGLESKI